MQVETIGDAYMVVSGLPIRNGKQHAKEISLLALDILENVKSFKFKPSQKQVEIRIGIHCGMYLLFTLVGLLYLSSGVSVG